MKSSKVDTTNNRTKFYVGSLQGSLFTVEAPVKKELIISQIFKYIVENLNLINTLNQFKHFAKNICISRLDKIMNSKRQICEN